MKQGLFYIFGGTGDLSFKKLYPAFYSLFKKQDLPEDFHLIVVGRRNLSSEVMREQIRQTLRKYIGFHEVQYSIIEAFLQKVIYFEMSFDDDEGYERLLTLSCELSDGESIGKLAYLATAPEYFEIISQKLARSQILEKGNLNHRIVIEKPFGKDLESAHQIDKAISAVLEPNQIYRMDHYLGKSMIQNLMILRFSNAIFEASWNCRYIDHVQITVAEDIGVGDRGGYYDRSGAIRDMIQSHLLQIVALLTMDQPKSLNYDDLCDAKVKALNEMVVRDIETDIVLGQYVGDGVKKSYREEKGIKEGSSTETFVALKMQLDNIRWRGVDFFLRTGKHLKRKVAEVTIFYKNDLHHIKYPNAPQNKLTIRIQPEEGTSIHFNLMAPANEQQIIEREMDFCQSCLLIEDSPEAYEKLIYDVIVADRTLYTRWDEVEASWRFVDRMLMGIDSKEEVVLPYEIGSWGPKRSDELLGEGRTWVQNTSLE